MYAGPAPRDVDVAWDWLVVITVQNPEAEHSAQQLLKRFKDAGYLFEMVENDKASMKTATTKTKVFRLAVPWRKLSRLAVSNPALLVAGKLKPSSSELRKDFKMPDATKFTSGVRLRLVQSAITGLVVGQELQAQVLPLHEENERQKLSKRWVTGHIWKPTAIHHIRNYMGDEVGYYVAFLDTLTKSLVPLALVGLATTAASVHLPASSKSVLSVFFALFLTVWATVCTEMLKRREAVLRFQWRSNLATVGHLEPSQDSYLKRATPTLDPATGLVDYAYPQWKRAAAQFFSAAVCLGFSTGSLALLVFTLEMDQFAMTHWVGGAWEEGWWRWARLGPQVAYSGVVVLSTWLSKPLSHWLSRLECHRTSQEEHSAAVMKLVCLHFVNNFAALFYVAFGLRDLEMLERQLQVLMLLSAISSQVLELGMPFLARGCRSQKSDLQLEGFELFADYLELWIQFGNLVLFGVVAPWGAALALANNLVEMRTDAHRLLFFTKRPIPFPRSGYRTWLSVFEFLGTIAILTNVALVAVVLDTQVCPTVETSPSQATSLPDTVGLMAWLYAALDQGLLTTIAAVMAQVQGGKFSWYCGASSTAKLCGLVVLEHILVGAKWALAALIPDQPSFVHHALLREQQRLVSQFNRRIRVQEEVAMLLQGIVPPTASSNVAGERQTSASEEIISKGTKSGEILAGNLNLNGQLNGSAALQASLVVNSSHSGLLEEWAVKQVTERQIAEAKYRECLKRMSELEKKKRISIFDDIGGLAMVMNLGMGAIATVTLLSGK